MKKILFLLCLLSASLTSTYANTALLLSESKNLNYSSWDNASKCEGNTITLGQAWVNWGWDYSTTVTEGQDPDATTTTTYTDFSGYDGYTGVTVTFTTNVISGYLYLNASYGYYGDDGNQRSSSDAAYINKTEADDTSYTLTVTFDENYYDKMCWIYFSACDTNWASNAVTADSNTSPTITITNVELISKDIQPIVNINNEAYIQTYWPEQQNWNESNSSESGDDGQESGEGGQTTNSDTITPTTGEYEIPGATLTYNSESGNGLGWGYYETSGYLDISAYKGIEVKYTVSQEETTPTITLEMGSKTGEAEEHEIEGVSGNDGTISFTFSSDEDFDPANVVKIVIKATSACTVNVEYIKLVTTTIETSSTNFITTTTGEGDDAKTSYYVNLNVTKTGGYWGTVTTDDQTSEGDPITSATITFKRAENLVGFQYEDTEEASEENGWNPSTTYLNLKSYTPASDDEDNQGEEQSTKVEFSQLEISYTISSTAERQSDRIRVMLELMDKDYYNIEPYDNYCIGRIRVNFDDYNQDQTNYTDKIDFENIRNITFMLENIPDDDQPVLNIESIRLLTADQVEAEKGQEHNLLISQLYTWQDIEGTKITPVINKDGDNTWASENPDISAKITTKTNWTAASWWVNNVSEDEYWGVELKVQANQHCIVRLSIENATAGDGTFVQCISERGDDGSSDPSTVHTLILPFLKKDASEYNKNLSYTPANSTSSTALTAETEGTEGTDNSSTSDGSENLDGDVNEIYLLWGLIGDSDDNTEGNEATIEIVSAKLLSANAYSDDFLLIPINSDEGYGTYYNSSQNYRMPYGMKGTTITGITDITKPTTSEEDDTGDVEENTNTDDANDTDVGDEGDEEEEETINYTTYTTTTSWNYKDGLNNNSSNSSSEDYDAYVAGDIVPAGTPLLLQGSTDQDVTLLYTAFVVDDNSSDITDAIKQKSEGNLLHGTDNPADSISMADTTALDNNNSETDYYYYKLSYLKADSNGRGIGNIGFYWGATDGVAFEMKQYNHAWLAMDKSQFSDSEEGANGIKISGFANDDESENVNGDDSDDSEDTTTGISVVPATVVSDGAIYNLQGVRVNDMNRKGIYIVDGKKIVKQ